jgi:hypothetical protein
MHKILIAENGITREATPEEIEYILQSQSDFKSEQEQRYSEDLVRANAKAALLDRLGITEDEAKLLLG